MSHIDSIKKTCDLICSPGQVVEVRAFRKRGVSSGYFTDYAKLAEKVAMLDADPEYSGIYLTLNEINPDLLARRSNRFEMRLGDKERTTSDDDIISRRWFPIDIDPKRPSGISSSDEEHEKALRKAEQVRDFLSERGWPEPISADSGNGAHLLYPISLPNDGESCALIKSCLSVLSMFFSDDDSDVDTSVSNAARIWKLYGTISRKGDSTQGRPHRRSSLLHVPDTLEIVSPSLLTSLASLLCEQPEKKTEPKGITRSSVADLGAWLSDHHLSYREKPFAGGRLFLFDACPFSTAHTDGAYAIQFASGGIFAGCHHNSCGGGTQRWSELRERFEGPRPKQDYEARIKQSNRNRAKAKLIHEGRYDPGTSEERKETTMTSRPSNVHTPNPTGFSLNAVSAPSDHFDDTDALTNHEDHENADVQDRAMDILLHGSPLDYSLQTFSLDHEGDEVVARCLAYSLASRAIANPKSKGLHVSVTGISGKGKSHAFDVMLSQVPDKYKVGERLSDKALFYAENLSPGMVITMDDTSLSDQMQEVLKGVTSNFQKPFRYKTVNKDRKGVVCQIPERCLWWIAKVEGTGDDQVLNRMLTAWIDESEEQDLKVLSRTLRSASAPPEPEVFTRPEMEVCQAMWEILFSPVWVVIPYAEDIRFSSAQNRRNPDMLIDLIRANAIIHQFQRTREEKHGMVCVTATMEDFQAARSLYTRLSSDSGGQTTKLTRNEAALIQAIKNLEQAEVTIPQLQRVCGSSYRSIYRMIHGYTSRGVCYSGLLEKCPALSFNDRTITDEREGTNVRRRTKAYQWDALIYETWCTDDSVWISGSVLNEGDSDDSDDHNGSDLSNGQQYQHAANICCPSELGGLSSDSHNTQCTVLSTSKYSNRDDRATPSSFDPDSSDTHTCAVPAAIAAHEDQTLQDISLNANQVDNVLLSHGQHVFVPAANSANQSLPDTGTMSPVQSPVNREIESIRTLPGLIPLTRMVRATKEYGRCHVCMLQGIAWWDQETKTGICQTCYEREILIHKESVT